MAKKADEEEPEEEPEEEEDPPPPRGRRGKRPSRRKCPSCDGALDKAGLCESCDAVFDEEGDGRPAGLGARVEALEKQGKVLAPLAKLADTLSQGFLGKPAEEVTEDDVKQLRGGGGGGLGLLSNVMSGLSKLAGGGKKGKGDDEDDA